MARNVTTSRNSAGTEICPTATDICSVAVTWLPKQTTSFIPLEQWTLPDAVGRELCSTKALLTVFTATRMVRTQSSPHKHWRESWVRSRVFASNDPSAGSPTETLLRLLLPLDDQVRHSFRHSGATRSRTGTNPRISLNHPIGSSDGRCVQRAGT